MPRPLPAHRLKSFATRHFPPGLLTWAKAVYRGMRNLRLRPIRLRLATRLCREQLAALRRIRTTTFPEWVEPGNRGYMLAKILCVLGTRHRPFDPRMPYDLVVNFQDNTFSTVNTERHVREASGLAKQPVPPIRINFQANDISKRNVARLFAEVFGYELAVDPRRFAGLAVEKSDANYAHDGRVISCPIPSDDYDERKSYTRLVDNTEGDIVLDMRVPIIGTPTAFFYLKRRPVATRFANANLFSTVEATDRYLSQVEIERLTRFSRLIGLDYGELDCLRDKHSRLLYVVDVNKTPVGPPNGLSDHDVAFALEEMSYAFATRLILVREESACSRPGDIREVASRDPARVGAADAAGRL